MGKEKTGWTGPAEAHVSLLRELGNFLDYAATQLYLEIKPAHHIAFLEFCVLVLSPGRHLHLSFRDLPDQRRGG